MAEEQYFWKCVECDESNKYPQVKLCETCGAEITQAEIKRIKQQMLNDERVRVHKRIEERERIRREKEERERELQRQREEESRRVREEQLLKEKKEREAAEKKKRQAAEVNRKKVNAAFISFCKAIVIIFAILLAFMAVNGFIAMLNNGGFSRLGQISDKIKGNIVTEYNYIVSHFTPLQNIQDVFNDIFNTYPGAR